MIEGTKGTMSAYHICAVFFGVPRSSDTVNGQPKRPRGIERQLEKKIANCIKSIVVLWVVGVLAKL